MQNGTSVAELLRDARHKLKASGVESAGLDALLIMSHVTGLPKEALLAHGETQLGSEAVLSFAELIKHRAGHMPTQYILNTCEFMGMELYVDERTLIPRPDTETLAGAVIAFVNETGRERVLDMCTGSGCVAVSVAAFCKGAVVTAADINAGAADVARRNAVKNGVDGRVNVVISDLFDGLAAGERFDVIASNPPYIKTDDIDTLQPNVKLYEPHLALDGGVSGLDFYERITACAPEFLNAGGRLYFEVGFGQHEQVAAILSSCGFKNIDTIRDFAGIDRVVYGGI